MENIANIDSTKMQEKLQKAVEISKQFGATKLILFGSVLHKPSIANDIDLACDGVDGWSFYQLGAQLEEELQIPLDLVALKPSSRFTQYIEKEGRVLFEI